MLLPKNNQHAHNCTHGAKYILFTICSYLENSYLVVSIIILLAILVCVFLLSVVPSSAPTSPVTCAVIGLFTCTSFHNQPGLYTLLPSHSSFVTLSGQFPWFTLSFCFWLVTVSFPSVHVTSVFFTAYTLVVHSNTVAECIQYRHWPGDMTSADKA